MWNREVCVCGVERCVCGVDRCVWECGFAILCSEVVVLLILQGWTSVAMVVIVCFRIILLHSVLVCVCVYACCVSQSR